MAVSSVTTDYSGRQKDVFIFHGINPYSPDRLTVTPKFGKVSGFCAGVQKLVQRYAISLLTQTGSQEDFPDFGSSLLTEAANGHRGISIEDIRHIFNFANAKVVVAFREYQAENPDLPLDEQLDYAILENVEVSGDYLSLDIRISTLSGDSVPVVLPLPKNL